MLNSSERWVGPAESLLARSVLWQVKVGVLVSLFASVSSDAPCRFERDGRGEGQVRRTNASRRRPLGSPALCADCARTRPLQLEPRSPIIYMLLGRVAQRYRRYAPKAASTSAPKHMPPCAFQNKNVGLGTNTRRAQTPDPVSAVPELHTARETQRNFVTSVLVYIVNN